MQTTEEASKADRAYHELRHRLIMLDIPPGAAINEVALTMELGIGRTPIREALKRLESNHLVASYARRGTFASNVDITDLAAISELREVLEPLAARQAASSLRETTRAAIEAAITDLTDMDPQDNQRTLLEYDLSVHRLIYRSANNHHLALTLERLDDLATRIWCLVRDRIPDIGSHITEHIELLRAILDQDGERAAELAAAHVRNFEATVRTIL